jgi:hypothetical protein
MKNYLLLALLPFLIPASAFAEAGHHPTTIYTEQGGKKMVVQSGATLQIDSGAIVKAEGATVNNKALSLPGRGVITICGDGTTINNNTVYYGASKVPVASGERVCDITQVGNTTEATADAPAISVAFQVLSMDCLTADPGASGVSFTLRDNAAATVPSVTCSVANAATGCVANVQTTTAIAANNPISIAAASAGDQGTTPFACQIHIAY